MQKRISVVGLAVAVLLAACSTDTSIAPSAPNTGSKTLGQTPVQFAPRQLFKPLLVPNAPNTGFVSNDGKLGFGATGVFNIKYWGGGVITSPKLSAIYYGVEPVYTNGPQPGTSGVGTRDNSLVGYFLNNLGGSSYWNINSTYVQTIANAQQFVNNTMEYTGFWAANKNAPRAGDVVTDNDMAN